MMENKESVAVVVPNTEEPETLPIPEDILSPALTIEDQQKCTDPLINVIQKLSKIVKSEKSRRFFEGKKRSYPNDTSLSQKIQENCATLSKTVDQAGNCPKRSKEETQTDNCKTDNLTQSIRNMFYQCSLCKFISASFECLKEHVKQHGQQNEVILMCSECHLTFKTHDELETHIKQHFQNVDAPLQIKDLSQQDKELSKLAGPRPEDGKGLVLEKLESPDNKDFIITQSPNLPEPGKRKWYAYEEYGLYRCLICRYTCGQQRMLKTHAWKHAGEVDCSYPIFEEDNESASLPDSTVAHTPQGSESVLSEDIENKPHTPMHVCDTEQIIDPLPLEGTMKGTEAPIQTAPGPKPEVVVEDALSYTEQDNLLTDSLLSSAQKIISCSQNNKGHVNVIVERLPSAEETVSQKPFLINTDLQVKKSIIPGDPQVVCEESVEVYHADKNSVENEEIVIGWSNALKDGANFQVMDENSPPVRQRTNSECLRLHSLAAEALVTMPIRVAELPKSSFRMITDPHSIDPDTGQRDIDASYTTCPQLVSSNIADVLDSFVPNGLTQNDVKKEETELIDAPIKMGISMSLLTVIEKLRERTDQNATDEEILKELQDNAQCQSTSDLSMTGSTLVEYIPLADRPYRCRLCHYTSGNKGYIKQHLRVHRQRQPYQCPICEHIADNSTDLESHMINHCKTRMYQCKHCNESFYYKSQLRNHEREHHSLPGNYTLSTPSNEADVCSVDREEKYLPHAGKLPIPKLYRCDVCSYTSSTYVGVRNHRRIHNSDKPYRCHVCLFATTNMSSFKCHMKRHPEEDQAVQLVEQYKCSLCGYVCSHPPSLKSHMWKHASDQNYNYEQVNKAINDAMSQSTRDPGDSQEKGLLEDSGTKVDIDGNSSASQPANELPGVPETPKINPAQITSCDTDADKLQSQSRPGMEYCVLLFCCCICGFESTSKELLMEHMKAHEGEIINIILNKTPTTA
ncbi:hypothetical protein FKM82_003827 [Ascaphus truei]